METVSNHRSVHTTFQAHWKRSAAPGLRWLAPLAMWLVFALATGTAGAQSYPDPLVNTAQVALPADIDDPNAGNNTATDSNALAATAALAVTKTLTTASPVSAGGAVSYRIEVTNAGPSAALGATVTDTVPPELSNVGWTCVASSPASSCAAASGTGDVNVSIDIAVGDTVTIVVSGTAPNAGTVSANTVTIAPPPGTTDPDPTDNTDSVPPVPVTPIANLAMAKTLTSASPAPSGSTVTYRLVVSNAGPSDAIGATIADTVPAELTNVSWTCTASGTSSCGTSSGSGNAISLTANIGVGGSNTVTINVSGTAPASGSIGANTATVTPPGGTTDPDPGDNTSTTPPVPVALVADLSVVKTLTSASPAPAGSTVTYQIVVGNAGPSAAIGATIADAVPAQLTSVSWTCVAAGTSSCGTANGTGNSVSLTADVDVGAGNAVTITVSGTAPLSGTIGANTATVAPPGGTTDPNPGDNTSTAPPVPVTQVADLSVVKTLTSASPAPAGSAVTYQIVVSNAGPSAAIGAAIADSVPTQLNNVSWTCVAAGTSSCGTTSGTGNSISLTADVEVGAGNTVTINVSGTAPASGTIGANTVSVTPPGGTTDPNPGDNTSTTPPVPVALIADLTVVKTLTSASPAPAGSTVTYQIMVSNAGPSEAIGATIADTVPAELTNVGWSCIAAGTSSCGSASGTGGSISVTANVSVGAGNTITITVTGTAPLTGTIGANTATVTPPGGTTDPNPGDNTSTAPPVPVTPRVIVANDDNAGPVNGTTGGTAVINVLTNDTLGGVAVNPADVTLTPTNAGPITIHPDGTVDVAPNTPAGTYTATYQICENLNPANCDSATVTVTVAAAAIDAVDDAGATSTTGGVAVTNVLANDALNGATATTANITLTQQSSSSPNVSLETGTGVVNVAPGTAIGTYTLTYQICEQLNPGNCDTATVTVTVAAIPIVANDDNAGPVNGTAGGTAVINVLTNDTLGGVSVNPADITLTPTNAGPITINTDGTVDVAPNTPAGTYTATYQICENANPGNCDGATVTVTVAAAVIDAVDDSGTVLSTGGTAVANVLVNDTLNGAAATTANISLTQQTSSSSNVSLDTTTGAVDVAPGTAVGTYTLTYRICEQLNPANCDSATATVTVTAAVIDAVDDSAGPVNGTAGGTAVINVLTNDTLNGVAVNPAQITLTPTNAGPLTIHPDGTVDVAPNTPAGTYTATYQICETANPANCDSATVTVTVAAAAIDAVDDAGATTSLGGTAVVNVLVNDSLNGVAPTTGNVTLTQQSSSSPNVALNTAMGAVTVVAGTPAGTYTLTYRICEQLNPTNCDTATVAVTVTAAPIVANDDVAGPVPGSTGGTGVVNVLTNDTLGGVAVNPAAITLTPTSAAPLTINPDGSVDVAPNTPAGTYTATYQICESANPANCDTATVAVTVAAAVIDAVDDAGTATSRGGTAVANVLTNDTLDGAAVTLATITLSQQSTSHPNVVLTPSTGAVTVAPATPGSTYALTYQICEQLNPGNCDTATVTVTVTAPVIDAVDDSAGPVNGSTGATAVVNVLSNDTLGGAAVNPAEVTLTPANVAPLTINPDGSTDVAPNTPAGPYTATYQLCDNINPTNCDSARVTVTVAAAPIDAVDDDARGTPVNGSNGGVAVASVLANDSLDGGAATIGNVLLSLVGTSIPGVTLDTASAAVSVAADTPAGTYTLTYRICERLNPGNCDTAIVSVAVTAAVIDAIDDNAGTVDGASGGTGLMNVLGNDTLDAGAATTGNVTLTSTPTGPLTIRPDGMIDVAARTPRRTYSIPYRICQTLNPGNCDSATATVEVTGDVLALRLSKRALQRRARVGELVRYTLTVENTSSVDALDATLMDTLPAGFSYVDGSLSVDDVDDAGHVTSRNPLAIAGLDIPTGGQVTISYSLRVGAGAGSGIHTNRAVVQDTSGQPISNIATADVEIAGDPLLEDSLIVGTVFDDRDGDGVQDAGERGVPGVRIASIEGLIVETDAMGRYHLVGIPGGAFSRGRLFILKVDPSTLPNGTTFTTENPRVRRITPGLPVRFDFGVKLPEGTLGGGTGQVDIELGEVIFVHGSAQIPEESAAMLDRIAATVRKYRGGRVTIAARADGEVLAFQRAQAVQDALLHRLDAGIAAQTRIEVTTDVESLQPLITLDQAIGLNNILFDTDKSTVRPRYRELIREIARTISKRGQGLLEIQGHADLRGSVEYNQKLGMRRARAVFDAIAADLTPEVRQRLRIDVDTASGAVLGASNR